MSTYPVIHITFESKSFSYASGLYAIIETSGDELRMCKLNEDGSPQMFDDGRPMISCTGKNNKGIKQTGLTIKM